MWCRLIASQESNCDTWSSRVILPPIFDWFIDVKYNRIEGFGSRFEWVHDVQTNNPDFFQFMLENNETLYNYVSYPCDLSSELEILKIGQYSMNDKQFTRLRIDQFSKLTAIEIGIRSFAFVSQVEFTNNPNLKSIQIADNCFCGVKSGSFSIQHNANFELLVVGDRVAPKFNTLEIDGRTLQPWI